MLSYSPAPWPLQAQCGAAGLPPYVEALLCPDAFSHPADALRLHETHISWVILAGPYAYKIKKPVNLGFLDFSTIERRAAACADEVRLNRRLAPDVYLGVVSIVLRDGRYVLGGEGQPVEPAVWMRRLPEEGMLDRLLARSAADARLMHRIALRLARFHARAATGPGVDEYGTLAAVRANWLENFDQTRRFVDATLPQNELAAIEGAVFRFLEQQKELFRRRVRQGRIRDGHGDLHAGSICLDGHRLVFFDCIEFSPRYRCGDVAAEVAFLAMDLDHYGRGDLAEALTAAYVRASGDAEVRRLLPFYQCYRAYVRGKVQSLRLLDPSLPETERPRVTAEARAYFDLAWSYAGGLPRPLVVVVMGAPEHGRARLADGLAQRLGWIRLAAREETGDREVAARSVAALCRRASPWLHRGRSVVLAGSFDLPERRGLVRRLAARHGVPAVFLLADLEAAVGVPGGDRRLVEAAAEPDVLVVPVDGRSEQAETMALEALRRRLAAGHAAGFP